MLLNQRVKVVERVEAFVEGLTTFEMFWVWAPILRVKVQDTLGVLHLQDTLGVLHPKCLHWLYGL